MFIEEPEARTQQFAAVVAGKLYMWGGGRRTTATDIQAGKKVKPSTVEIFDPHLEEWTAISTSGLPPLGLFSGACSSYEHYFYVYGGYNGSSDSGLLHQLDTRTHTWCQMSNARMDLNGPHLKSGCKMVCVQDKLVLFGGSATGDDWVTDELHTYGLKTGNYVLASMTPNVEVLHG